MDSLIFFLVALAIIATNVIKAKKKLDKGKASGPKPESPPKVRQPPEPGPGKGKKAAGRWQDNIREMLAELQKETAGPAEDKQKQPARPGPSPGWEDLVASEKKPPKEAFQSETLSREVRQTESTVADRASGRLTLIESRSRQGWAPEARIGVTERRQPAPSAIEPRAVSKTGPRGFRYSRDELCRAVIWYEVLGPPMSLRDPEREMWL